MSASEAPQLRLQLFDGQHAREQAVCVWLDSEHLHVQAEGQAERLYLRRQVRWAERTRYGARQTELPDGALLSCADGAAWDAWARASGLSEPLAVRLAQSWSLVLGLLLFTVLLLFSTWRWGLPAAASQLARWAPPALEQQIGTELLALLDRQQLKPSRVPEAEQQALQQRLQALLQQAGERDLPNWRLHFRAADEGLGPNALALPGGDIIVTDALLELLRDQPDALLGVLCHELGHLRHRHGLRLLIQSGAAAAVAGAVIGDFSSLLALAPALLAERAYARDFEREADAEARRLLLASGRAPTVMIEFFDRIERYQDRQGRGATPLAIASHPTDEERRQFFGVR